MSLLKSKKLGLSLGGIVVLALGLVQGCSNSGDDSQATPTGGTSSGGTASHAGSGNGGSSAAGHSGNGAGGSAVAGSGNGGTGGVAGSPDTGAAGEGGAQDCSGPDGCYNCSPSTTAQFLNHCVEGGCQPAQDFHLPATLPALP